MKTILYQPLFINPQAYFVFPQLYHIEKGDSYIEPANITGQLIINNLSDLIWMVQLLKYLKGAYLISRVEVLLMERSLAIIKQQES